MKHSTEGSNLINLLPAAEGRDRKIIEHLPYVHASVCPSVHSSRFYINLYISFIYKISALNFQGMFVAVNVSVQNFGLVRRLATIADRSKSLRCSKTLNIVDSFIRFAQKMYG